MTGSAKQSIAQRKERMDCFVAEPVIGPAERPDPLAPRNDEETTNRRNSALPRREAPGFCVDRPRKTPRGRREDRVRAAPAVSCAKCTKGNAHEHTGSAEAVRPSLRNGLTAYNALSPVTGFLATVAQRIPPRSLMPAPGHQDHTPSPFAPGALVSRTLGVHRIPPHVRDDRERLSERSGTARVID